MGGACSTYGGRREGHTVFWWGNVRERDYLEDPGIKWENNIKMDLRQVRCERMDWTDPAQNKDRRRALVNAEIYLWVP
jgi:hypothetical protein